MNIAILSQALPYLPSRGGFRLYGGNLIRHLSRRHEIHLISVLASGDEKHLDWAQQYCSSVTTIPTNGAGFALRVGNFISATLWGRPTHCRKQLGELLKVGVASHEWDVLHIEGA